MLELDGSQGEGGGQILRTALTLAMCTGSPFRIESIRAKRSKPGLLRQHLTAVLAATEVCDAKTNGATIGSQSLEFIPGKIKPGDYRFAIGSAGSCTLVLQTVLPALLFADGPSHVLLEGGTHNPFAPPFHFLERVYLPLLARMGAKVSLELKRFGFYPAGGGTISATINPVSRLEPLELLSRGERRSAQAESFIAGVPAHVAKRELEAIAKAFGWEDEQLLIRGLPNEQGPGNALFVTLEHENVTECFVAFGEKGVTAEAVAKRVIGQVRDYTATTAAVGPYLADQLLLPLSLAGGGSFTASGLTQHALTNIEVIGKFLPIDIQVQRTLAGDHKFTIETSHQ
ncbi:MAG TPA: RNA 3'-terminal phosphate cyclase [Burkholderiales bacterium]|nr:RNA 3'-terminal phosphate cyclase [Burkholderiales bacterium]